MQWYLAGTEEPRRFLEPGAADRVLDVRTRQLRDHAGGIVLLVFSLIPGNQGPNRYGDDPKGTPMAVPYPPYPTYQ
jgi:hypothetical protein